MPKENRDRAFERMMRRAGLDEATRLASRATFVRESCPAAAAFFDLAALAARARATASR